MEHKVITMNTKPIEAERFIDRVNAGLNQCDSEGIEIISSLLQELDQYRWISVDDPHKPNNGDTVLILFKPDYVYTYENGNGYAVVTYDDDFYHSDVEDGMYDIEHIESWLPMPSPNKEGDA